MHHGGFSHLEGQVSGRALVTLHQPLHKYREIRLPQVVGRDVDGNAGWGALLHQSLPDVQGFAQYPAGQWLDQASLFCQFNDFKGCHLRLPVGPADQGLEPRNVTGFQAQFGLQVQC